MVVLTDEQQMIVDSATQLAENEFSTTPGDRDGEIPWDNIKALADAGFIGANFDLEYGGGGFSEFETILLIDAVGRVCPETAFFVHTQSLVAPRVIHDFGSDAAKEKYLPSIVDGSSAIAIAISEPNAGSDIGSMTTCIEERDGELVLNGEKTWVSNVPAATAAVVWTKFPEGLGAVVIDLDTPGVEIGEHFTNMADHTQTQFFLNDVVVPTENILIRGRDRFSELLQNLNWERLGNAMVSNTIAACALDAAVEYAQDRQQFDQPIADFQGIEWKLADMVSELEISRAMTYQTAGNALEQGGYPDQMSASIAKVNAANMVEEVTSEALQIHGANGYQQGHALEFLYRFGRANRIAAGTDEMQRNLIASEVKKRGIPTVY